MRDGRLDQDHRDESGDQRRDHRSGRSAPGEHGREVDTERPGIGEHHHAQREFEQRQIGVALPVEGQHGHQEHGDADTSHADTAGDDEVLLARATAALPPRAVEVLDHHRGHGVERGIGGRDGGRDDADRHKPAQARRHLGQDVVHEDVDLLSAERAPRRRDRSAHEVGAVVMEVEQQPDRHEDEDHRDRRQHRQIQAARARLRIAAGEQTLGRVLVETVVGDVEQRHPRHDRQQGERLGRIERQVEQAQLVDARRCMAQRFDDLPRGGRYRPAQIDQHRDRRAEIDDELDEIVPQHRFPPAVEGEQEARDHQGGRRGDDAGRIDPRCGDHRDRDRREIDARAAGQHAPDRPGTYRPPTAPRAHRTGWSAVRRRSSPSSRRSAGSAPVDDARDRGGAVDRRRAAGQHFDALDERSGNRVDVDRVALGPRRLKYSESSKAASAAGSTLPAAASRPPSSYRPAPRACTSRSIMPLAGPVSNATTSPSGPSQVRLATPPRFRNATGRLTAILSASAP